MATATRGPYRAGKIIYKFWSKTGAAFLYVHVTLSCNGADYDRPLFDPEPYRC